MSGTGPHKLTQNVSYYNDYIEWLHEMALIISFNVFVWCNNEPSGSLHLREEDKFSVTSELQTSCGQDARSGCRS